MLAMLGTYVSGSVAYNQPTIINPAVGTPLLYPSSHPLSDGLINSTPQSSSKAPGGLRALNTKYGILEDDQMNNMQVLRYGDGKIAYRISYNPANKPGPSAGAYKTVMFNPKTGEVLLFIETVNNQGVPVRVHLKNINGIDVDALHFPPTGKELGL